MNGLKLKTKATEMTLMISTEMQETFKRMDAASGAGNSATYKKLAEKASILNDCLRLLVELDSKITEAEKC